MSLLQLLPSSTKHRSHSNRSLSQLPCFSSNTLLDSGDLCVWVCGPVLVAISILELTVQVFFLFIVDLGSLQGSSATASVPIGTTIVNSEKSIARAFLNGINPNPETKGLQLQIEAKGVQQSNILISVSTGPATSLKSVQLSYLIFSPNQVGFSSYGGYVSRTGFSGVGYQAVAGELHSSNLMLLGVVRISAFSAISLSSTVDSDFVFGFQQQGSAIDFVYSYVAFGVNPRSVCAGCSEKVAFENTCVSEKPTDTYTFTYKDGSQSYRRCSSKLNLAVNANGNGCVCAPGAELQNGVCVLTAPAVTNSWSTGNDFASLGVNQAGSGVTSISQLGGKVTTITNGATIISIGNSNGSPNVVNTPTTPSTPATPVNPNANSYVPTVPTQT